MSRLLLLVLFGVAACHGGTTTATSCTAEAEPAVVVTLRDADDQQRIHGATLTIAEGSYVETMLEGAPGDYYGGAERPGTYRIEITAAGYVDLAIDGVTAPATHCGPVTQELEVELQRAVTPAFVLDPGAGGSVRVRSGWLSRR